MNNKSKKAVIKISTVIDANTRIEGNLFSENNIKIDGKIDGHLHSAKDIVVSQTGVVNGNIVANAVIVHGKVMGNITTADTVTLAPSGKIEGDVQTVGMIADIGSSFHGRCQVNKTEGEIMPAKFEIKLSQPDHDEKIEEQPITSELLAQVANDR